MSPLPRILLMGPRRSGKTSIKQVVFNKMSPHETLFRLEGTVGLDKCVIGKDNDEKSSSNLVAFEVWDFPGDYGNQNSNNNNNNMSQSDNFEEPRFTSFMDNNDNDDPYNNQNQNNNNQQNNNQQAPTHTDHEIFAASPLTCIVFILDAQDEPYDHTLQKFADIVSRAYAVNPYVMVEVFINKIDGCVDVFEFKCRFFAPHL
jgi:hypothetical protein